MTTNILTDRINIDADVMTGKPTIKGTRITVQHILKLLATGMTQQEILQEYPLLKKEDIFACLLFATEALDHSAFFPSHSR